jgi:hypothetical protein
MLRALLFLLAVEVQCKWRGFVAAVRGIARWLAR